MSCRVCGVSLWLYRSISLSVLAKIRICAVSDTTPQLGEERVVASSGGLQVSQGLAHKCSDRGEGYLYLLWCRERHELWVVIEKIITVHSYTRINKLLLRVSELIFWS